MALVGNTVTKGVAHDDPSFASLQVRGNAGFFGKTPIAQPAPAVAVGTDLATVILEIADLRAQCVALGLIAS